MVALLEDGSREPRRGINVTAAIIAGGLPVKPQVVSTVLVSKAARGGSERHEGVKHVGWCTERPESGRESEGEEGGRGGVSLVGATCSTGTGVKGEKRRTEDGGRRRRRRRVG